MENKIESIFEVQFAGTADGGFIFPDLLLPSPPATYSFPKFNIPTAELLAYADTLNDQRWRFTGEVTQAGRNHASFGMATSATANENGPNEQSGPSQAALSRLNAVRTRAGLRALVLSDVATQQAFRNEVERQRRLELAFEGERWFDLLRYARQTLANPTQVHQVIALDIIQQMRGTRDVNYLLFPFPQTEINNNSLLQQNPGY
ncbi:RagB/SusD family nutrient uptake outer membrane protein [Spirosoma horti]